MKYIIIMMMLMVGSVKAGDCFNDKHSTNENDSWLSCEMKISPNVKRGNSHWILYDLGKHTKLKKSTIWNYNVSGKTNLGAKNIAIDYSADGKIWKEALVFNVKQATGSSDYAGIEGPDFNSIDARYVLLTVIESWQGSTGCAGLSEIKIETGEPSSVLDYNTKNSHINLYPNPATQTLSFSTDDIIKELTIVNTLGIQVFKTEQIEDIDISFLQNGVYFVKFLNSKSQVKVKGFIKR